MILTYVLLFSLSALKSHFLHSQRHSRTEGNLRMTRRSSKRSPIPVGVSKRIRKFVQNHQVPDLRNLQDVNDFITRAGYGSESEADDEAATVSLPSDLGRVNGASTKSAVKLQEIGPRMTLDLIKIEEGLCSGVVIFSSSDSGKKNTEEEEKDSDGEEEFVDEEDEDMQEDDDSKRKEVEMEMKMKMMMKMKSSEFTSLQNSCSMLLTNGCFSARPEVHSCQSPIIIL